MLFTSKPLSELISVGSKGAAVLVVVVVVASLVVVAGAAVVVDVGGNVVMVGGAAVVVVSTLSSLPPHAAAISAKTRRTVKKCRAGTVRGSVPATRRTAGVCIEGFSARPPTRSR